jgi:hypothetical protein
LTTFILAVKLFILEVPVNRAYKELSLAYDTTHKIYVEINENHFGGKGEGNRGRSAKDKILVFEIFERNGKMKAEIVRDVSA